MSPRYRLWCWKKWLNEPEIRLAGRIASGRCLDIGANAGAYSYFMLRAGAKVEAFEPIPELADMLRSRFGSTINVHQCAASDADGKAEISVPMENGRPIYGYSSCEKRWDSERRFTVQTRTVDSFGFDNVGLIKIDVEGFELAVLNGAADTIRRCNPVLIVEAEEQHRRGAVDSVQNFAASLGYTMQTPMSDFNFVFLH